MFKKVYASFLIFASINSLIPIHVSATEETYFIVTAYYSPLPNQQNYLKGNYEDEIILNGKGIAGASGKPVFSGMLAAPKKYAFGTKIYLEGLGIGEVSDRGGAIVPAGQRGYSYDRIDIWMGYGDEGLKRALYWGKRKVKGSIVSANSEVNLKYDTIPAPNWATRGLSTIPSIFYENTGIYSSVESIKRLQELLQSTGHYHGKVDGIYNSEIIDIIADFQSKNKIETDLAGTGYWGYTTRNTFLKQYLRGDFVSETTAEIVQEKSQEEVLAEKLKIFDSPVSDTNSIKKLQQILVELGIYAGNIDGLYSSIREDILSYQIEQEIILTPQDIWAGYFGPNTRADLKENYSNYIERILRQQELEKIYDIYLQESLSQAETIGKTIGNPVYGDISSSVRELQIWLKKLGYAEYSDTAIFGTQTQNSILDFQVDTNLIQTGDDLWAGKFGPKTKKEFVEKLWEYILIERLKKEELFEEIQAMTEIFSEKIISESEETQMETTIYQA